MLDVFCHRRVSRLLLQLVLALILGTVVRAQDSYDVVVYGGTSAGIMAAVQSAKMGKSVVVVEPGHRIGGMTTGGLGNTDTGIKGAIGGLALEFYRKVGEKYQSPKAVWDFEPKVALEVLQDYVKENKIPVVYGERLDLAKGVDKRGTAISAIHTESGKTYQGRMFIDATYEGDLMARAGVSYTIGREANSVYGETLNGIRPGNQLPKGIDPYRKPGDPSSGLLARVNPNAGGAVGDGDKHIMAYNYRMVLTNRPENRVMIEKPAGYNEEDYEILFRAIEKGMKDHFFKLARLPNDKTDSNNDSGISTDYIGTNYGYPEGDYATRDKIAKAQETYQKGYVWTLQNHPRVPQAIRDAYKEWGLPLDEFTDNNHWPSQLYVREGRRMLGQTVVTEDVAMFKTPVTDTVGMASYALDSHHTQYCVGEDGFLRTEGGFFGHQPAPFPISYGAIVPKAAQCTNLLVVACVSATHAAYGSIRMEPVFMILGQSAGTAACLALDGSTSVQDVPYDKLKARLDEEQQVLTYTGKPAAQPKE